MQANHYQLIGARTEALLFDGRLFPKGALIEFSEGRDSEPSDITRRSLFVTLDMGRGTSHSTVSPMVEFCVENGSDSETNLMMAAMSQGIGDEALLYVKHADDSVYEFSTGRFTMACERRGITATFRDARQVSSHVYEALRGPREVDEYQYSPAARRLLAAVDQLSVLAAQL